MGKAAQHEANDFVCQLHAGPFRFCVATGDDNLTPSDRVIISAAEYFNSHPMMADFPILMQGSM